MKVVNVNLRNALLLFKQKNYLGAKVAFLELIKKTEVDPKLYYTLYQIFNNLNELNNAKKYLIKFLEFEKKNHVALNNLANLYLKKKEFNKAEVSYLKAIDYKKDYLTAILNLALYYQGAGNIILAKKFYNKGIELSPKNLGIYFNLNKIDQNFLNEKRIKFINTLLKKEKLDEFSMACGYFLIAENKKKNKKYEKEIESLKIAHKHAFNFSQKYNEQSVKYWLDIMPKKYNKIQYISSSGNEQNKKELSPIFIIGLPRSGSTIVETIISSGKEKILNLGETNLINWSLVNTYKKILFNNKEQDDLLIEAKIIEEKLFSALNNLNGFNPEIKLFTEKSLENFFYIDLILKIFPKAKFIHTFRNTQDNVFAIFQKFLTNLSWTHSLENILSYVDNYLKIINIFKKKYPNKILSISLEKLTEKNKDITKNIYKFCGIEWSDQALEFYKRKDLFSNTASNIQIRSKLQKYDYEKYKPYKQFLKKFSSKYQWIDQD